jgi:hypothetical protein
MCLNIAFVIFREAAIEPEPCEAAFDNPGETRSLQRSLFSRDNLQVCRSYRASVRLSCPAFAALTTRRRQAFQYSLSETRLRR